MMVLLVIIWILLVVGLIIVSAVHPERSRRSWFELQHRKDEYSLMREKHIADIEGLCRLVAGLLLMIVTAVGFLLWQAWGIVAAGILWMLTGWITRRKTVHAYVTKLYKRYEDPLLRFVMNYPLIGMLTRTYTWHPRDQRIESPDHLLHLVETADTILSTDQQRIIQQGLQWHTTPVSAIMVARKDIVSIKYNELLGPLVLDDLHRSGHSRFPVAKTDAIVGILDITELLEIDSGKRSQTAERAMSRQVLHVESDEPLPAALLLLQKSRQHILVVIDKDGETAGIVTLADITGSLLG